MKQKEAGRFSIEIPYLPKSLNYVLRMHKIVRNKYFTKCKTDVWYLVKAEKQRPKKPYKKALMKIIFTFPDNSIRDFDNMVGGAKGMIDGIKRAGIIEDDSWQKLKLEFSGGLGEKPETYIEIQEIT